MDTVFSTLLARLNPLRRSKSLFLDSGDGAPRGEVQAPCPAITLDGHTIRVCANLSSTIQAKFAIANGADGVGLFRTEFMFMAHGHEPDETSQLTEYRRMLEVLGDRPLVYRVLDVGGDKHLPYLESTQERNPSLGVRGIRFCFAHQHLLITQLRALFVVSGEQGCSLMFPMISDYVQWQQIRDLCRELWQQLIDEGHPLGPLRLGIMVEVPSVALQADLFAGEADFFSIGTNDLAQFTLACERDNPDLKSISDALHPAVLRLIEMSVRAARKAGRWVSVCGDIASDPDAIPLLLGLGVNELSVPIDTLAGVKRAICERNLADCQQLAQLALQQTCASDVRKLVR